MPEAFWPELILGWAYQHKGMHGQALAALRNAVTHSSASPFAVASLAQAQAAAGERTPARQLLTELFEMARHRYVSAYDLAAVYAGLGDSDEALTWLRRAHAERSPMLVNIGWDPRFNPLREDPGFHRVIADMKLPERPAPRPRAAPRPARGM
jgi:tetratricopeptide (TPR) repeat protein